MPTILKKNPEDNDNDFKNSLLSDLDVIKTSPKTEILPTTIPLTTDELELPAVLPPEAIPEPIETNVKPRKRVSFGKILALIIILISVVLLSFGGYVAYSIASVGESSLGQGENMSLLDQTKQILGTLLNPNKRTELKGESEGRTNFLLIGVDVSANLTDTIIIGSYYYKENKFVTLNVPRDTLAYDGYETQKINGVANGAIARSRDKTQSDAVGAEALSNLISKEYGIPIHYWAKVNFQGVKQIVDELGGIEVDVKKPLYDNLYPNDGYKVINGSPYLQPPVNFKVGVQNMDGRTALIYARSRETTSDFDRNERQSIVIQAILQKIKSQQIFENVSKISSYLNIIGSNFKTSLKIDEIYSLSQILKEVDVNNNFLRVVWSTGNGILCTGPNPELAYTITYCGGAIIGKVQVSASKLKAKNTVQDLLKNAEQAALFDANVALLSNQSSDLVKIQREFDKSGFNNVRVNNAYKSITAIKKGAYQTKTLYILDPKIKNLYDSLDTKPDVGTSDIQTTLPSDIVLPKGYENTQILVWVS